MISIFVARDGPGANVPETTILCEPATVAEIVDEILEATDVGQEIIGAVRLGDRQVGREAESIRILRLFGNYVS